MTPLDPPPTRRHPHYCKIDCSDLSLGYKQDRHLALIAGGMNGLSFGFALFFPSYLSLLLKSEWNASPLVRSPKLGSSCTERLIYEHCTCHDNSPEPRPSNNKLSREAGFLFPLLFPPEPPPGLMWLDYNGWPQMHTAASWNGVKTNPHPRKHEHCGCLEGKRGRKGGLLLTVSSLPG